MYRDVTEWVAPDGVCTVPVETTAYYAVQLPKAGVNPDTRILCVLHGWGQRCQSFLRRFKPLENENLLVVAPQGPHQFYLDMDTKKIGFTWLTVYDRNSAVRDLVGLIDGVLTKISSDYGIMTAPLMLGFSQGVSIAYRYHLLGARPVRGLVACGGDLPPDVHAPLRDTLEFGVLLVHGKKDGIVPIAKAEEAERTLTEVGLPPETFYFDGDHEITPEAVAQIGQWVLSRP